MKTLTIDQIIELKPCYTNDKVKELLKDKNDWSALDILTLDIPLKDKLWAILREDFIDAQLLHEFACRCAENALVLVNKPDPRSITAIAAKRAWVRGEITTEELKAARTAAWEVRTEAWEVRAAWEAATAAWAAAWEAASEAAWEAAWKARAAAWEAATAAKAAWEAAREITLVNQVEILTEMIYKNEFDEKENE